MDVNINNELVIGNNSLNDSFHIIKISGLGTADIRTSQFLFSGRDGGMVTDQFYDFRQISIEGKINSASCVQHQLDRNSFVEALPIRTSLPIYITNFAGQEFLIYCNVIKTTLEYLAGGTTSDFLLQLIAGDPLFYSTDGGDEQTASVSRVTEGGYITPYILPVVWEEGSSPTIVINSGNTIVYPVITLHDSAINPTITNQLTNETFALDFTIVTGDDVIIDMARRTVTLNGSNIIANKTADSVWWGLQPGNNPIILDSDSDSDGITATLTWKNGRTGI